MNQKKAKASRRLARQLSAGINTASNPPPGDEDDGTSGVLAVAAIEAGESALDTSSGDSTQPDTSIDPGGGSFGGGGASGDW